MYKVKRVDDISEGFAHLSSVSISDHRMKVDLREGDLTHHLLSKEDHPGNPKEQNVVTSFKELVRVEVVEIRRLDGMQEETERERERERRERERREI